MESMSALEFRKRYARLTEVTDVNGALWVPRDHPLNEAVRGLEAMGAEPIKGRVRTATTPDLAEMAGKVPPNVLRRAAGLVEVSVVEDTQANRDAGAHPISIKEKAPAPRRVKDPTTPAPPPSSFAQFRPVPKPGKKS